jgi:hypothetical protein
MKQWELRSVTSTAPAPRSISARVSPNHPSVRDRFPLVLWATDSMLRLTTKPRIDAVVALGGWQRDIFNLSTLPGVADAHLDALKGTAAMFELPVGGRSVRCFVFPIREENGEVTGTVSVAMGEQIGSPATEARLPVAG